MALDRLDGTINSVLVRGAMFSILLASLRPARADQCKAPGFEPYVLTPASGTIASNGGVLVAARRATDGPGIGGDASQQPSWRWSVAGAPVTPTIIGLAPGLAEYLPPEGVSGPVVLRDGTRVIATIDRAAGAVEALLPPPHIREIRRTEVDGWSKTLGHSLFISIAAVLDEVPPPDAVALVVFSADGAARSWAPIAALDSGELVIYAAGGRCAAAIPGTKPTATGDRVTLAWVDRAGRLSNRSDKQTVRLAPSSGRKP